MTENELFAEIEKAARENAMESFHGHFIDLVTAAKDSLSRQLKELNFDLLRAGTHYASVSLGRWFRGVWDHEDFPPFGQKGAAVKGTWERFYDTLPPGINLLTDRRMKLPFIVQFGGTPPPALQGLLYVTKEEVAEMNAALDRVDLFERLQHLKTYAKLANFEDSPDLKKIDKFAGKLGAWCAEWSDTPRTETELALSFLFTWYPTLKACENGKSNVPMVAVVLPLPDMQRPPDSYATIAALVGTQRDAALGQSEFNELLSLVANAFSPILHRLLAVDAQVLAQRPAKVSLRLERVVRGLQYITTSSVQEQDDWKKWRRVFPKVPASDNVPDGGDPTYRWDIPMWGASAELNDLYEKIKRAVEKSNKFDMVFLYSPPGCGKENIARLCHYLSPRSHDRNLVKSAFEKTRKLFESENDFPKLLGRRRPQLENPDQELLDIAAICEDGNHTACMTWDFNYFVAQGGFVSRREAYRDLVGDLRDPKDKQIGLLVRATACGGTVFLDELSTMKDTDANLFLRIAEKPHEVELPGLPSPIELNCLLVFASNDTPKQLEAKGWNPAVLTRIAKPGRYFEIPPLEARPVDIAITLAYYLERRMEIIEHFDPKALRWLCRLPWRGNYRELIAVLDRLMEKLKTQSKERQKRVDFEDLLDAYFESQV